jgi:hypothetical protein
MVELADGFYDWRQKSHPARRPNYDGMLDYYRAPRSIGVAVAATYRVSWAVDAASRR